jgi:DNA polymerase III gamma/tau subunit
MKFSTIVWEQGERPERLYQRILAHLQDNLLRKDAKLKHDDALPAKDEDMCPTVERLAVLRWMELLNPSLPALVQRTFAYDLQRMTLKDLQPQTVDALDGFMEELRHDEVKSARVYTPYQPDTSNRTSRQQYRKPARPGRHDVKRSSAPKPQCRLCKAEGRPHIGHTIAACYSLSRTEKQGMVRSYKVDMDHMSGDEADQMQEDLEHLDLDEEA